MSPSRYVPACPHKAMTLTKRGWLALALTACLGGVGRSFADEGLSSTQRGDLPAYFGFGPVEIFKIEFGIDQLRTADFNNDGRTDLVVANNNKSTLEVLLQRHEPPDAPDEPADVNDLANDWRFERKPLSVTWSVVSLQTADLTGDGNIDLVFFGDPKELVVFAGEGDGAFTQHVTRRVRDGVALPSSLAVGDLNGDGRCDVALLAESDVVIYFQREKGGIDAGKRFSHALDGPVALDLADLDGDGRLDLVIATQDEEYPVHVRYQDALGNLGPLQRVKLPGLRSAEFAPCLDRRAEDLFGVERVSGRLKRWSFSGEGTAGADEDPAVLYYPLPGKSRAERLPLALADVDGDGRPDLVSADVDAAELALYRQQVSVGLLPVHTFGGQVKMRDMCGYDADGDGAAEVYVLSADEEFIARSAYHDERLTFPRALPTRGKPYALDVGKPIPDRGPALVYVARNPDGKYELVIQPLDDEAAGEPLTIALDEQNDPPSAVRIADVNRDGLDDVLIFTPYAPLTAIVQRAAGEFAPLAGKGSAQQGLVKQAAVEGFTYADTDGDGRPEVLLAQAAFVRALCVNENGAWEILDQYNAPAADAEISGVTTVALGGQRPHLVMYDRRSREVYLLRPEEGGTYELDRSVPVGAFDLKAIGAAPLAGDAAPAIMLADNRRVALVLPQRPAARAREEGVYESSIKNPRLTWVAAGDVNHDGRTDLVVLEVNDHFVEVLTFGPDDALVRGTKFRVFAKKQIPQRGGDSPEPRWAAIADVTADGIDDLLLIAHDRILLYPGQ